MDITPMLHLAGFWAACVMSSFAVAYAVGHCIHTVLWNRAAAALEVAWLDRRRALHAAPKSEEDDRQRQLQELREQVDAVTEKIETLQGATRRKV